MLLSMTGFGKASVAITGRKVTVEIKTLNSKSTDISTRLSPSLREADLEIRRVAASALTRGKIDITVVMEQLSETKAAARLNVTAIDDYRRQIADVAAKTGIGEPGNWWEVLLRCPDAFIHEDDSTTPALAPEEHDALMEALGKALEGVTAFRAREGEKLEKFFEERVGKIKELLGEVQQYEGERVERVRQRLEEGLANLQRPGVDANRLEQELIFYIEKFDVTEEKQRLGEHIHYFLDTMNGPAGQGRKLGFIAQEMGREINTLGSKSNHAAMQRLVVKMKDELEQIKEQVLNVL